MRRLIALLVLILGLAVAAGCSGNDDLVEGEATPTADLSAASAEVVVDDKTVIECANVERAYNAWEWEPSSSLDFSAASIARKMDQGDEFLSEVKGYTDDPALGLASAIADYNYQLALANATMAIEGSLASDDIDPVVMALSSVTEAYDMFRSDTCS